MKGFEHCFIWSTSQNGVFTDRAALTQAGSRYPQARRQKEGRKEEMEAEMDGGDIMDGCGAGGVRQI